MSGNFDQTRFSDYNPRQVNVSLKEATAQIVRGLLVLNGNNIWQVERNLISQSPDVIAGSKPNNT